MFILLPVATENRLSDNITQNYGTHYLNVPNSMYNESNFSLDIPSIEIVMKYQHSFYLSK